MKTIFIVSVILALVWMESGLLIGGAIKGQMNQHLSQID